MIGKQAYEVGIKIMVTGSYAAAFAAITKSLTGIGVKADEVTGKLGKLHLALGAALGVAVSGMAFRGMAALVEKTKDLSDELAKLQQLGATPAEIARAQQVAIGTTHSVRGVTRQQALAAWGTAYAVSRNADEANAMNPMLEKTAQVLGFQNGGDYTKANEQLMTLLRAADMLGRMSNPVTKQFDQARLQNFLDLAVRTSGGTHGMIDPATWLMLGKRGGPSLRGMSDQGLMLMGIAAQYMGGSQAGTSYMSLMQQMAGGTMFTRNAVALQEMGLLGAKGKVDKTTGQLTPGSEWGVSGGRIVISDAASKRLMGMIQNSPNDMLNGFIGAMNKTGVTGMNDEIRKIFALLPRQTSQRLLADFIMNEGQFVREMQGMMGAPGVSGSKKIQDQQSVTQNIQNVTAAYNNLGVAFQNSEVVISFLKTLTSALDKLNSAVEKIPPNDLRMIWEGVAGAAAVIGTISVATLIALVGPAGLIAGAVTAVGALIALDWKGLVKTFTGIANAIDGFITRVKGLFSGLLFGNKAQPNPGNIPMLGPSSYTGGKIAAPQLLKASLQTNGAITTAARTLAATPLARNGDDTVGAPRLWRAADWQHHDTQTRASRLLPTARSDDEMSAAIPPADNANEITLHSHVHLDGRIVARNTMKHIVRDGNGPATGARLPDWTATRAISI